MTKLALACLAMSLISFGVCGYDKGQAGRKGRRVPESSLLLLAAAGGSPGLLLGMLAFRHKTRKAKFCLGVPAILALQLAGAYLLLGRLVGSM